MYILENKHSVKLLSFERDTMNRNRQFYCHRCNANVQIDLAEWKCRECSSGFVEEVTAVDNGANNENISFSVSHR